MRRPILFHPSDTSEVCIEGRNAKLVQSLQYISVHLEIFPCARCFAGRSFYGSLFNSSRLTVYNRGVGIPAKLLFWHNGCNKLVSGI